MFNHLRTVDLVELDQFGLAIWRHKYGKTLFVQRPYRAVDRVVVIDETDGHRSLVDDCQFTKFNFSDWIPVTVEQHKSVKNCLKEIYENGSVK